MGNWGKRRLSDLLKDTWKVVNDEYESGWITPSLKPVSMPTEMD